MCQENNNTNDNNKKNQIKYQVMKSKEKFIKDPFPKYDWGLKLQESLYSLQSEKTLNETNSTTSVIKAYFIQFFKA